MGLDYDHTAPSEKGICYQLCSLNNERFDASKAEKNTFYYYDFTSNVNTKLGNHYRPVEYIGGTDKFYITSDFYGNLDDHFIKLYVQNSKTKNFEMYDFEKDDLDYPIIGSAILSKNIFLAYKESGFFIIDLSSKAYTAKTYSTTADVLENDELEALDYKDCVTGMTCYDKAFCFSTISNDGLTIHEITGKSKTPRVEAK